ncbi:MAG: LytTR family DNA-binding domain-containing protein [Balneolaceae bacterium]
MKVLICEDEAPASKMLVKLLKQVNPFITIVGIVETGESAARFISEKKLDLIFMDIELADGSCFESLQGLEIKTPIIFTTAYHEYALKAFDLNAIDYIVKPISISQIEKALNKFSEIKEVFTPSIPFKFTPELLGQNIYKNRFLVKLGRKLFPIDVSEIAFFMASDKFVWLVTKQEKKYIINYTLSELEETLNPKRFFRLNRQFITQHSSIKDLEPYFKGQVIVNLIPEVEEKIIVSRNKTPELKSWLGV